MCEKHYMRVRSNGSAHRPWDDGSSRYALHHRPTPQWSQVSHKRVYYTWGKASQYPCVGCGGKARDWAYDGTDPTELYTPVESRRPNDWQRHSQWPEFYKPMCQGCHLREDGSARKAELHEYRLWKNRTGLTLERLGSDS